MLSQLMWWVGGVVHLAVVEEDHAVGHHDHPQRAQEAVLVLERRGRAQAVCGGRGPGGTRQTQYKEGKPAPAHGSVVSRNPPEPKPRCLRPARANAVPSRRQCNWEGIRQAAPDALGALSAWPCTWAWPSSATCAPWGSRSGPSDGSCSRSSSASPFRQLRAPLPALGVLPLRSYRHPSAACGTASPCSCRGWPCPSRRASWASW